MSLKKGATCAQITPFTEDGKINVPELESLVQMHLDSGTDNLCILGTTAEASVMTMEEREVVLNTVVGLAKGKIPIMVGTGTINPDSVRSLTQQAIDLGADANLLVTPYYVKPPQRALIKHFTSIADMGLPMILYNVPGRTASNIETQTVATLAEHPNIVGIKDATGNIETLTSMIDALGENNSDFLKYSGDDGTTLDFVRNGGDGCISVVSNVAPGKMKAMLDAALAGDLEKAKAINDELDLLHSRMFVESNPIPAKWAAKRVGLISNAFCRPPLDTMDPQYEPAVEEALKAAGLI